jgi:signal peptidase I
VVEGFVIPTGSMAPTLMGAHARVQSKQTGWSFAIGMDQPPPPNSGPVIADPMLGPAYAGSAMAGFATPPRRMGDRILVLKCLYPFFEPRRFDVVVFKNPTKSQGDEANYIKRLIGLPNDELWLCDGDVFVRRPGEKDFAIQRKPEHVQRAVWQPVYDSDYIPVNVERLNEESGHHWVGPPWVGDSSVWDLTSRTYHCSSAGASELRWDGGRRELDDWASYNIFSYVGYDRRRFLTPVSDVRVSATIVPEQAGLTTRMELQARSQLFEYIIEPGRATLRMRPVDSEPGSAEGVTREAAITLPPPGRPFRVECWHVDQSMRLFIDGREVMPALTYDWTPVQRLQNATGSLGVSDASVLLNRSVQPPRLRWAFNGSALSMNRVSVDRDLFYRRDTLQARPGDNPTDPAFEDIVRPGMPAYGTHPDNLAKLGPDQFMMLGDNSQMSLDSRLWRNPDPLVASQIDPHPFLVNRKLLLGKAWVVYFPSPYPVGGGGLPVIPDFGRLRFIR